MSIAAVVAAKGTLTSDATIPTAADTVTVGSVTYTYRASVSTTANEVKLGSTAATALQNLHDAINLVGDGTGYGSLTAINPDVKATAVTATTITLTSKVPGTVGNFIPTTEASTHLSFGAATLGSGTGSIATAIQSALSGSQLNAEIEAAFAPGGLVPTLS